jgi:hypothetical protein
LLHDRCANFRAMRTPTDIARRRDGAETRCCPNKACIESVRATLTLEVKELSRSSMRWLGRKPGLTAEHVSPTIKHEAMPCDRPILAMECCTTECVCLFTAPGKDRVGDTIMEDGGF